MKKRKFNYKKILILLLPIGILLSYISSLYPKTVEIIYSNELNKYIREALSIIFSIFPFSVGEIVIILFIIFILYYTANTIVKLLKYHKKKKILTDFIINCLSTMGIIYFSFMIVWGLNYHRLPFYTIAKLNVKPASVSELGGLCESLINKANNLRTKVLENNNGVMYIPNGQNGIFNRASKGYILSSKIYPELGGTYGKTKGVIFSKAMSYAGISGVYFPFTAEPNVNIDIPSSMLPSTACHEMAHQRGFAREDEANYISYLVCNKNPDIDFQYSGTLLALINSMNALYSYDINMYKTLQSKYSKGIKRDLVQLDSFWSKYEGPIERISTQINNAYLKSNMQKNGVYSYGRMVDLLIAEYRLKK